MSSPVSSLTASRSSSPEPPVVQPDHFYGADAAHLPPSPDSEGKTYLSPEDDPLAHRGIPVFKPSVEEFEDFEAYMNRVECWGRRSGIVKVVPPPEWTAALPDVGPQLAGVKIKSPIEQFMRGRAGLFRQENVEKRKVMSVREWAELCARAEFCAPGKDQVGIHNNPSVQPSLRSRKRKQKEPDKDAKQDTPDPAIVSPPNSPSPDPAPDDSTQDGDSKLDSSSAATKARKRRLERADKDASFLGTFSPHTNWLPPGTSASDYTPEFCSKLERAFWRNCGLGKPAWYGADTMGSLFLSSTNSWNVASLPSTLSRLLPLSTGLPGVNTPYLYFGMWRATFAWHVEDMDLFSINYIHFGAPKFWYAVPQARANALEATMRGYFPKDTSQCPQFLRHKSFLASPTLLAQSAVRPNHLVQHAGEFVITYPRGYHAGFNLGFNCAESVNFALDSWLEEGRKAAVCQCVDFSVRIDVDQLLEDRRIEDLEKTDPAAAARARAVRDGLSEPESAPAPISADIQDSGDALLPTSNSEFYSREPSSSAAIPVKRSPRKRKPSAPFEIEPDAKRPRVASSSTPAQRSHKPKSASATSHQPTHHPMLGQKITLKLGPRPPSTSEPDETFPCCLCVDTSAEGLVRVHDLPPTWRELAPAARIHFPSRVSVNGSSTQPPAAYNSNGTKGVWMAHESCAMVLPETWVDEVEGERVVFGVDGIVRGRWSLKCSACTRTRPKAHGALIQCAKGKCPKAFHVNCARNGASSGTGIAYTVIRDVEKEVVLLEPSPGGSTSANPNSSTNGNEPNLRVLKVIKKTEVEALCAQHNPAVVAERRANKAEGLRTDILALPPLSRIKIRVSAGVFEVTLVRVNEERRSVEVLWDAQGEIREFKWGSVILGQTSLPTTQVPGFSMNRSLPSPNPPTAPTPPVPDAHAHWASASRPQNVITIPPTATANPAPTSHPRAGAQTQSHNPYNTFKFEYWPTGYGYPAPDGAYPAAKSSSSNIGSGTSVISPGPNALGGRTTSSHFMPKNQYYVGSQPWQVHRPNYLPYTPQSYIAAGRYPGPSSQQAGAISVSPAPNPQSVIATSPSAAPHPMEVDAVPRIAAPIPSPSVPAPRSTSSTSLTPVMHVDHPPHSPVQVVVPSTIV
ncbi:specific transcriptional repressor [Favolaschia claudopus]|uniref:[histone H3]-trimethyl-L-lysine(9) demethylase n=1 Tax=Favolaschia claudopus TaxID=2862362 RepID=A0AAW0AYB6_9AGAR